MDFDKFPTSKYKNYALQNTELFKLMGHCISQKEQAKKSTPDQNSNSSWNWQFGIQS
jgi:hypothetical protein